MISNMWLVVYIVEVLGSLFYPQSSEIPWYAAGYLFFFFFWFIVFVLWTYWICGIGSSMWPLLLTSSFSLWNSYYLACSTYRPSNSHLLQLHISLLPPGWLSLHAWAPWGFCRTASSRRGSGTLPHTFWAVAPLYLYSIPWLPPALSFLFPKIHWNSLLMEFFCSPIVIKLYLPSFYFSIT